MAAPTHQRELFAGLIRIHALVHASCEPIFGLAMMEELNHHGYRIGPGTLYPLLHGMERDGLLKSQLKSASGRRRRIYNITALGKKALGLAKKKIDELHDETPRRARQPAYFKASLNADHCASRKISRPPRMMRNRLIA